ncbi:MAG: TIGR03089 family protein [Ornithinimicrobium sp.]
MFAPADVLSRLIADDPTKPAVTFYEDTPGDTYGERIELSRKVLGTWVSKAANALQEGLDCEPGTVVLLDVPSPHWRLTYWALAIWSVGATLTLDASEGADVMVTTAPHSPAARDADEVIAVSLPALSRSFGPDLRTGIMDEAREIASFGDSFSPWDQPEPGQAALVCAGERTAYRDVVPGTGPTASAKASRRRLLITSTDPAACLPQLLGCWAEFGSAVLVRGSKPDLTHDRMRSEGVDALA